MEWLIFSQRVDARLGASILIRMKARAASLCVFEKWSLWQGDISKEQIVFNSRVYPMSGDRVLMTEKTFKTWRFPINRPPQRVGTRSSFGRESRGVQCFQSIGVPTEWGQRPPRGLAPQAIRRSFAHPPTLPRPARGVKPVENAEIRCAAVPRTDRRKDWGWGDRRGGCAGTGKGKKPVQALADQICQQSHHLSDLEPARSTEAVQITLSCQSVRSTGRPSCSAPLAPCGTGQMRTLSSAVAMQANN